ncbi:hypothetical protein LOTGIDRAFT_159217 [Lottia gigantea]|uniref:Endonuclease/exonuclease/phosphatase domain-containing protein n=1 Tax=Lottia gigantea TaxID=225164 RepID=V4C9I8_LOTGI|nr:hypothetical protein LOTGIDRAFT_159217 [Lottia gigantea]ESO98409.1 hypothetical protein LOTGIDRAFT_159217 [Lottia gigantea]
MESTDSTRYEKLSLNTRPRTLCISHLNVNGWTARNHELREKLITFDNSDIICVNETHLQVHKTIDIKNYRFYPFNRESTHVKAEKPSRILNGFKTVVIDKLMIGILVLSFEHKDTNFKFVLFSAYLLPENSQWDTRFCVLNGRFGHFFSSVSPKEYCSGVWGFKQFPKIEQIQNRAIRYFLGLHRFTPKAALNGDMGWLPPHVKRWLNMLKMWNRIIQYDMTVCLQMCLNMIINVIMETGAQI